MHTAFYKKAQRAAGGCYRCGKKLTLRNARPGVARCLVCDAVYAAKRAPSQDPDTHAAYQRGYYADNKDLEAARGRRNAAIVRLLRLSITGEPFVAACAGNLAWILKATGRRGQRFASVALKAFFSEQVAEFR